jgi:hypothetical protein
MMSPSACRWRRQSDVGMRSTRMGRRHRVCSCRRLSSGCAKNTTLSARRPTGRLESQLVTAARPCVVRKSDTPVHRSHARPRVSPRSIPVDVVRSSSLSSLHHLRSQPRSRPTVHRGRRPRRSHALGPLRTSHRLQFVSVRPGRGGPLRSGAGRPGWLSVDTQHL